MRAATWILTSIAVVYAVVVLCTFPVWTVDDAYITCRYAQNLANHGVLTWNIGETPVEGYTGVALPVLLAMLMRAGIDPVLGGKIVGVLALFVGGALLYHILRELEIAALIRGIGMIFYFGAPFAFTHALSGLETTLFTATVLAAILAFLPCLRPSPRAAMQDIRLMVLLLATGLTRPEGVALAAALGLTGFLVRIKNQREEILPFVFRFLGFYVAPGLIYFLWRWRYYGDLLPNTYYVKAGRGEFNIDTIWALREFFLAYLYVPAAGAVVAAFVGAILLRRRGQPPLSFRDEPEPVVALTAVLAFAILVLTSYAHARLIMNFSFRFFAPLYSVFLLPVLFVWDRALKSLTHSHLFHGAGLPQLAIVLFVLVKQTYTYGAVLPAEMNFAASYARLLADEHIPIGKYLAANLPATEWVAVYVDAGAIPYYSRRRAIDFGALNDRTLAHRRLTPVEVADYFFMRRPGAAAFTSNDPMAVTLGGGGGAIIEDPRFRNYALVRRYRSRGQSVEGAPYYEFLYLRRDLLTLERQPHGSVASGRRRHSSGPGSRAARIPPP